MGELSPWHILIVVGVFVLLFGSKKLPDAARSLGRSMRILKTEIKDLRDDDKPAEISDVVPVTAAPVVAPAAVVVPSAPVEPAAPVVAAAPVVVEAPLVTTPVAEPVSAGDQTPAP